MRIKDLDKLRKNPKPVLVKMAKGLGIKVSVGWNRTQLATTIIETRKLKELEEPEPQEKPESPSEPGDSGRRPDFETLASEAPEIAPDLLQDEEPGAGGVRIGAGRPSGLTDEKVRVRRILQNKVPDPMVQFVVECIFGLAGEPKKAVEPTPETIAVPATNLINYYFPSLNISPVLSVWFDFLMGSKNLVVSNLTKRKAEAEKAQAEKVQEEKQ